MIYRQLGKTGLMVSEIGLGCEGMMEDNCAMAETLINEAERAGVNYFDLFAPNPDLHKALAKALKGRREKFFIQGHIGSAWIDGQYARTRKLEEVKRAFEAQLQNLETDHLDVGMIHYVDALADWDNVVNGGTLAYAKALKAQGRINFIGLSSHNPHAALKAIETGDIDVLMFSVNPCYDLLPGNEDIDLLFKPESYQKPVLNLDPDRAHLYEVCQSQGVGITVMKCFGGGALFDAKNSPAGVSLRASQLIHYALTRPAVATVLSGARTAAQLRECAQYEDATPEQRDYARAFANLPKINWEGHCMYCGHCAPCPQNISVADVTKFLNLAKAQSAIPETVRNHYELLPRHAGDCIACGACETRCPFGVKIRENMREAAKLFGL